MNEVAVTIKLGMEWKETRNGMEGGCEFEQDREWLNSTGESGVCVVMYLFCQVLYLVGNSGVMMIECVGKVRLGFG